MTTNEHTKIKEWLVLIDNTTSKIQKLIDERKEYDPQKKMHFIWAAAIKKYKDQNPDVLPEFEIIMNKLAGFAENFADKIVELPNDTDEIKNIKRLKRMQILDINV